MVVGGISCSTSYTGTLVSGYTALNPYNTIDVNGTLNGWCFKSGNSGTSGTAKLKIFRINGANYDFIGESSEIFFDTYNTIYTGNCNIAVLAGDLVGVYLTAGALALVAVDPAQQAKYYSGDVTTTTAQSGWAGLDDLQIIVRTGNDYAFLQVYVDINKSDDSLDGTSWATAKKTMKAGWDLLDATGTMHVASGNYSAQTGWTWNKSWKLSPEDPNTTGEKRVAVPPSV